MFCEFMFLTFVTQHTPFVYFFYFIQPSCHIWFMCFVPYVHSYYLRPLFCQFSLITSVGLWPVSSSAPSPHPPSHQPNSRSLSSSHLIMRLVSKLVASLQSHGRQLPSEVGHMVRWVSGAGSSRARDSQRQQAVFSTLHFVNTWQQENPEGP